MKGGKVYHDAKTKDRCSKHPIHKFKPHETDPNTAKNIIQKILDLDYENKIQCACGSELLRWNYSRHCMGFKHEDWMSSMPSDVQELTKVFNEYIV